MKFSIQNKIKRYIYSLICLLVILFQSNSKIIYALPIENHQSVMAIEQLRLKVPSKFKEVWLNAENQVWEPWLSDQEGFLGRKIFWDKNKEEALILVNWKNRKLWKNIPTQEVHDIQKKFEAYVTNSLNVSENPFKLVYEGELERQL